tara:strand:+ start:8330 stop:9256 length:927 start_codon:yes stop_codon:yes gene_type:complete
MSVELTTIYLYKTFAGIDTADATSDVAIAQGIQHTSSAIEAYCRREFTQQDYRRFIYTRSQPTQLFLPNAPVTAMRIASLSRRNALHVGSTHPTATISATSDGVSLFSLSAEGGATSTDISFSAQPTLADMATAISAVSGWEASVPRGTPTTDSSLFVAPVNGSRADGGLTATIEAADPTDATSFRILDSEAGMIELAGNQLAFTSGDIDGIFAWYEAGYTMPTDNEAHTALSVQGSLPDAVRLVANRITKALLDGASHDSSMTKERIADYWWENDSGSATKLVHSFAAELAPFVHHDIAERSLYESF